MYILKKERAGISNSILNTCTGVFLFLFFFKLSAQPTIIFEEDFDCESPPGWQISPGSPTGATWQWTASGKADSAIVDGEQIGALFWNNRPPIQSPSADNGAMMFNSDAYDSAGIGVGQGPFPENQVGHLISPIINCQFHPVVYLKFNQYARALRNDASTLVSVSIDNGESWVDFPMYHPVSESQSTKPSAIELIDISSIAGGASNVRIRFTWSGRYYFWLLDDVQLIEAPDVELSIKSSYYSPLSFAQPFPSISADTFQFAATITNLGQYATDSVTVKASLFEVLGPQETFLFSDSILIQSLPAFCSDSLIELPNFFIPNLPEGEYRLTYEVNTLNQTDFSDFNNVQRFPFRITADEFAKEDDIDVGLRPASGGDYEVGNVYTLSGDEFESYQLNEVIFSAAKEEGDGSLVGEQVIINLYEIAEEVDPDLSDFQTNSYEDLTLIGIADYTFPESSQNFQFFHTPLLSITGEDIILGSEKRYLLTVKYEGTANSIFHSFNDDIDYNRPSTILYRNGWFMEGFGTERAAVLRLRLSALTPNSTEIEEMNSFSIFPNPANDIVNIKTPQSLENTSMVVTNSSGQILARYTIGNFILGQTQQINVSQLSAGAYQFILFSNEGIWRSTCIIDR